MPSVATLVHVNVLPPPPPIVGRVNGERLTVLGWGRAILLQLAHPLVAAGVAEHSTFRSGGFGTLHRLRHTIGAMLALTFGGDTEAAAAARGILAIHDRVHGVLPATVGAYPAGTPYSAHDPDLLLWVHATLVDSILRVYEDLVGGLTAEARDEYLAAAALGMTRIGLPVERAPHTMNALQRQLDAMIAGEGLAVSAPARELAGAVLNPPGALVLWPLVRAQRLLTVGLLPPVVRDLYGYAWSPGEQRRFDRLRAVIRRARALSPDHVARWRVARAADRGRRLEF